MSLGSHSTDNVQCSVHFTDQQYEINTSTGEVTVEWEGTGPSASVQVSQFECKLNNNAAVACKFLCHTSIIAYKVYSELWSSSQNVMKLSVSLHFC